MGTVPILLYYTTLPTMPSRMIGGMFVQALFLLAMVSGRPHNEKVVSPPKWVELCDHHSSYLFSEDVSTWQDAAEMCELFGGYLAKIDSMAENYCIVEYAHSLLPASTEGVHFWHSTNDLDFEGVHRQGLHGDYLTWQPSWNTAWNNGAEYPQPDGGTNQNCFGVTLGASWNSGKWWDDPCQFQQRYICERTFILA